MRLDDGPRWTIGFESIGTIALPLASGGALVVSIGSFVGPVAIEEDVADGRVSRTLLAVGISGGSDAFLLFDGASVSLVDSTDAVCMADVAVVDGRR